MLNVCTHLSQPKGYTTRLCIFIMTKVHMVQKYYNVACDVLGFACEGIYMPHHSAFESTAAGVFYRSMFNKGEAKV